MIKDIKNIDTCILKNKMGLNPISALTEKIFLFNKIEEIYRTEFKFRLHDLK